MIRRRDPLFGCASGSIRAAFNQLSKDQAVGSSAMTLEMSAHWTKPVTPEATLPDIKRESRAIACMTLRPTSLQGWG